MLSIVELVLLLVFIALMLDLIRSIYFPKQKVDVHSKPEVKKEKENKDAQ